MAKLKSEKPKEFEIVSDAWPRFEQLVKAAASTARSVGREAEAREREPPPF
jgi:hypothetical protein